MNRGRCATIDLGAGRATASSLIVGDGEESPGSIGQGAG